VGDLLVREPARDEDQHVDFAMGEARRGPRNHVEHIYAKIGASTRAAASLFAVQHGLLPDLEQAEAVSER